MNLRKNYFLYSLILGIGVSILLYLHIFYGYSLYIKLISPVVLFCDEIWEYISDKWSSLQLILNGKVVRTVHLIPAAAFEAGGTDLPHYHFVFIEDADPILEQLFGDHIDTINMFLHGTLSPVVVFFLIITSLNYKVKENKFEPELKLLNSLKSKNLIIIKAVLKFFKNLKTIRNFLLIIYFYFKKIIYKLLINLNSFFLRNINFWKWVFSKNLLWRPIFKRLSYWGVFISTRMRWRKL